MRLAELIGLVDQIHEEPRIEEILNVGFVLSGNLRGKDDPLVLEEGRLVKILELSLLPTVEVRQHRHVQLVPIEQPHKRQHLVDAARWADSQ